MKLLVHNKNKAGNATNVILIVQIITPKMNDEMSRNTTYNFDFWMKTFNFKVTYTYSDVWKGVAVTPTSISFDYSTPFTSLFYSSGLC